MGPLRRQPRLSARTDDVAAGVPTQAEVRPLSLAAMATHTYDITRYQPLLFAARSLAEVVDVVGGCFDAADDEQLLALAGARI